LSPESESSASTEVSEASVGSVGVIPEYKGIIQYALSEGTAFLNAINPAEVDQAKRYSRELDQPRIVRWLYEHEPTGKSMQIPSKFSEFYPPKSSDPLVNVALESLCREFFSYLESNHVAVHYLEQQVIFEYFKDEDFTDLFHKFLSKRYDNRRLIERHSLVKECFRIKSYWNPINVRNEILNQKIPLEVPEPVTTFGDNVRRYCLFCGRPGNWKEARGGYVDFAQQRPQNDMSTRSVRICPVCLFASLVSVIRTSEGAGNTKSNLIVLKTTHQEEPATFIFNRILGLTTGNLVTIQRLARGEQKFGKAFLTYLSASVLPKEALLKEEFRIEDLSSETILDKRKLLVIKAFETVLGLNSFWRLRDNPHYQKAYYSILRSNYYELFGHLGPLLSSRRRNEVLELGIYRLLRYGVISMDENPEVIFGTAFLIDSFMPEQWQKDEDIKTEARKVAFYLERPEEVLLRLRQMSKKDYATVREDFRNKASFMLLMKLLMKIHEKEGYGGFRTEQEERRRFVEQSTKRSFGLGNCLFLYFDDIIKVYLYIRNVVKDVYGPDPRQIRKGYSDFMSRIKYALIARRPELTEGGD